MDPASFTLVGLCCCIEHETCTASFWFEDEYENHMDNCCHWPEYDTYTQVFRLRGSCNQRMNDI